ncbi:MAG: hypothetical protein JNM70_09170 [Anaerolineae bacterium]|nr:hypothetical protein [Anaerolineae bacterium]
MRRYWTRRQFLKTLGLAALVSPLRLQGPNDWDDETPLAQSIREYLETVLDGRRMTLDFRRINGDFNQEFHIQIRAYDLYPVASCFKAWLPLYYYLNTARDAWEDGENTPLYNAVVFSSNVDTGIVLAEVARRITGEANPIEKFNTFLRRRVGMANGLYSWDWPNAPTVGFVDARFEPTPDRVVTVDEEPYLVDNAFSANDLAHGYNVLARGPHFARWERLWGALDASLRLLAIRAPGYQSPIEAVYPDGYLGKDGILPTGDLPLGRVVNDAGILRVGDAQYIVALMAAGENELSVREVLTEIVAMIDVYERGRPSLTPPGGRP